MFERHVIERTDFDALLAALERRGYAIVGPTIRDLGGRRRLTVDGG